MKPIGLEEMQNLRYAVQHFQDCYLVSSIGALTNTSNGRKILSENIAHTQDGFRIRFNNVNGKVEDYFVTQKEMDNLIYMDKYYNPIEIKIPHNPIIKAIEVAMNKLIKNHPSKKPWICRFPSCNEKFEFNKPSNFLEMFTGRKPLIFNEGELNLSLKSKRDKAEELLQEIDSSEPCSFVTGTAFGLHKGMSDNHCYTIVKIDSQQKTLQIFDHRFLETLTLTYEEAMKKLKFIVGYFNQDLK